MTFADRSQAGQLLAGELAPYQDRPDVIVLALPRGGVLVGREIAVRLHVPLDVLVVRKIGLPDFPEMAIGAIAPDGIKTFSEGAIDYFQLSPEVLRQVIHAERKELRRRSHRFRQGRPLPDVRDKVVILVDDGLATGQTMTAALEWVRGHSPREVIVAVPVGAPGTCHSLSKRVDRLVCLHAPIGFHAVGATYLDFSEVKDDEVISALRQANNEKPSAPVSVEARSLEHADLATVHDNPLNPRT